MPIYEYQCQACEKTIEALQKISDAPLLKCPKCGADALKKKVSAPTFRLKGSGWYETDFKTGSKKNLAGGGGGASAGEAPSTSSESKASESKSSESKPADSKPADSKSSESKKSA
jgi:putative FmdB family regulatory protein